MIRINLPIDPCERDIVETVFRNMFTIVVGETGSGKTSRLPQFLYNVKGLPEGHKVAVSEPRRNATISSATRVSDELGVKLGEEVSYQIRFDPDHRSNKEVICFMTTGILLHELQNDPDLNNYTIVIIDEAHERSIESDTILGLLKQIEERGNRADDLRIIIASATIDAQKFSNFFDGAPVIEVSGRTFPVNVHHDTRDYSPEETSEYVNGRKIIYPPPYVDAMAERVQKLCAETTDGDILCFLPGMSEIESTYEAIQEFKIAEIKIHRLHGGVSMEDQMEAINPSNTRKVILSTNIAETSLTISGVTYVIDCGFIKQKELDPRTGTEALKVVEHSRAGCNQRAGRAGRTKPGECYRLFTEHSLQNRLAFTKPEIQRVNLTNTVLRLLSGGITDIESFPFLDPPDRTALSKAVQTLRRLGAVNEKHEITNLGEQMAGIPVEPQMAKMLIAAIRLGCLKEALTVAAFLSNRSMYYRPKDKEDMPIAKQMWSKVQDQRSDFLTYIKIWKLYHEAGMEEDGESRGQWAARHYLNNKALREVGKVRNQLVEIMDRARIRLTTSDDADALHKSILAGYSDNLMKAGMRFVYQHLEAGAVSRHPGTVLFKSVSPLLVAVGIQKKGKQTGGEQKTYMDHVGPVNPEWLQEICPENTTVSYDWDSLNNNEITGKPEINQTITFRDVWKFVAKIDMEKITVLTEEEKKLLFAGLMYKMALTAQVEITAMEGMTFHIKPHRKHLDYEIAKGKAFVKKFFGGMEIDIDDGYIDFSTDAEMTEALLRQFSLQLREHTSALLEEKAGAKVRLLKEKLDVMKAKMTADDVALITSYHTYDYDSHAEAIYDIFHCSVSELLSKCSGRLADVEWNIRTVRVYYSILIPIARRMKEDEEEKEYEKKLKQAKISLLNDHVNEEYMLCPVCNSDINPDLARAGKTSCDCDEASYQEQFAFTEEKEVLLLKTEAKGTLVAELVAVRSTKEAPYHHMLRTYSSRIPQGTFNFEITYYYEEPEADKLEAYRQRDDREKDNKALKLAQKSVRAGDSVVLTFTRGANGKGQAQWQKQDGKTLYVCDKNNDMQPSVDNRKFFCRKGEAFKKAGRVSLVMVRPFLAC